MKPKRTILCVDDDEQSLSIRKVMLETRGYRVLTCSDPEGALELMRRGGIDLVITDLVMPKLTRRQTDRSTEGNRARNADTAFLRRRQLLHGRAPRGCMATEGEFAPIELLERIRVLLIRKRGPKRAIGVAQRVAPWTAVEPALPRIQAQN